MIREHLHNLWLRLKALLKRRQLDGDLAEELQFHLAMREENLVKGGMSPSDAHDAARREFGNVVSLKESSRNLWSFPSLESLGQDVRYGLRQLRRNPGFTAVAVLTLAAGIALNTAIFTAYDALRRPIQASDPNRIVNIYRSTPNDHYGDSFSYPDYAYYADHNTAFSGLIAASGDELALNDEVSTSYPAAPETGQVTAFVGIHFFHQLAGTSDLVRAALVSGNYFSTLGANPVAGRSFTAQETSGPYPVVMLSSNFWQRRFDSDPGILGKTLKLNGKPFTVIGITPKDFMGTYENVPSLWLPLSAIPILEPGRNVLDNANDKCCGLYGRLKNGATMERAQSEMTVLADQLRHARPPGSRNSEPATITLTPGSRFGPGLMSGLMPVLALVLGAVSLVLLIACANVAGLQLAKSAGRQKEIGVRLAIGASRARLVRQLLTEAILLALFAGAIAVVLSWLALQYLVSVVSSSLPVEWGGLAVQVSPDFRVFGYALGVSFVAGILLGLAPALEASKPDLVSVFKDEGTSLGRPLRRSRLRTALVTVQVAVCFVLLISGGLLIRGSARALKINLGFETKKVLGLGIEIPPGLGYTAAKTASVEQQLVGRLGEVPGVKFIARGRAPLGGGLRMTSVSLGQTEERTKVQSPVFYYSYVSPGYFRTLSIPIVEGRTFTPDEARTAANVAIVSQAAARKLWPGNDPLGKRVTLDASDQFHSPPFPSGQSFEVIGVTTDLRSAWLNEVDPAYFYLPLSPNQFYETVLVRTERDPSSFAASIGHAVTSVDPNLIVYAESLDGLITNNPAFVFSRIGAILSSIVGLLGLILAAVGIYGIVSFAVVQRTHEVGVRMAMGAQRRDVLRLIVGGSMRPVLTGLVVGVVAASVASRLLSRLLFGVSSLDPIVYVGVSLFLAFIAAFAAWIPARRATKVDPMVALRHE